MAENGINGHDSSTGIQWKCGFMNHKGCYLTAEKFGFKVNASGTALKAKQIWTIEQDPQSKCVYIKSPMHRYMTSDKYGTLAVDKESEEKGDNEKFVIEYTKNGKWAFKHNAFGNYLGGTGQEVKCFDRKIDPQDEWSIQFYIHPHVTLRNAKRQRYAHLNKDTNQIECTELVPWGEDSLLVLDFTAKGQYTLKSYDNRFLNCDGGLDEKAQPGDENKFNVELHAGWFTFKDSTGRYLTAVGTGGMKCRNKTVSKDEMFTIADSHPQVEIRRVPVGGDTSKRVSVKQGVDVSANQVLSEEITDFEIFQLEYVKATDSWSLLTNKSNYWCLKDGTVKANSQTLTKEGHFKLEWLEFGKVAFKGADDTYLTNKATGILISDSSNLVERNEYVITLLNRPLLVLKCEFGFVGVKGGQYICNKPTYDTIEVVPTEKGAYNLKAPGGKYLGIGDDKSLCFDDGPSNFYFEFVGQSTMAIKASNGNYLKGEQNGLIKAVGEDISTSTLLEY